MSQKLNENIELDPIIAPELTSSKYGSDINEKFQNIDNNFTILRNIDLYKGEDGNSLIIEEVPLSKDETDGVSYDLYVALADTFTNKFKSINSSPNRKTWDEYIETYKIPLVKSTNTMDENDGVYLGSIIPILFFDGRFSSESITENNKDFSVYDGIDDCTCIVQFTYENDEWKCIINESFPKLSYRNGNFYWVIGGAESTAIRATGVKGEKGDGAHIWMCNGVTRSDNDSEIIIGNYITSEEGSIIEKPFNNNGKIIEGSDATHYGVAGDPVFIFDYEQSVSDDDSGETYYKDYKGIVIAHLHEYNAETGQWIARVDGDIKHVNFVKNTVEFFKTLGENNEGGVKPARGLFLTTGTQNQCHSIFNKDNNLIIAPQNDYSTSWSDDGNVDFNPSLHVAYNTEFLNKAIFNTQNIFSGETNFTKDGIIDINCGLYIHDSGFISSSGNINSHGEFNSYGTFNVDTQKNISLKHNHGTRDKRYEKFGIDGDSHRVYLQTGKIDENSKKDIRDSEIVLDNGYITIGVNVDGDDYTDSRGIVIKTTNNDASVNSEVSLSKEAVNLKSDNIYSTGNYSHTGPLTVNGATEIQNQLKINFSGSAVNPGHPDGNKNSIFIYNTGKYNNNEASLITDTKRIGDYYAIGIGDTENESDQNLYINRTGLQAAVWKYGDGQFTPRSLYLNYRGGLVQIGSTESATDASSKLAVLGSLGVLGSTNLNGSVTIKGITELTGTKNGADGEKGEDTVADPVKGGKGGEGSPGEAGGVSLIINSAKGGNGGKGGNISGTTQENVLAWGGDGGNGGKGGTGIIVYGGDGGDGGECGEGGDFSSPPGNGGDGGTGIIVYGGDGGEGDFDGSVGNAIEAHGDVVIDGDVIASNIFAASSVLFLNDMGDWTNAGVHTIDGRSGQVVMPKKPAYMLRLQPIDRSSYIVGIPADIYPPNCIVMMDFYDDTYYLHDKDNIDGFKNEFRMFVFGDRKFDQTIGGKKYTFRKPIGWINCGFDWSDND